MATLLLIGPQAMGKTTIFNSARGKENPEKMETTINSNKKWISFGSQSIRDTPGEQTTSRNKDELKQLINKDSYIAFVFNSAEFIKEIENPEKGGQISSTLGILWKIWQEEYKTSEKKLFFVATFVDKIQGDAKAKIRKLLKEANDKYIKISGRSRYPYSEHFMDDAWFCCLNATNTNEVNKLIDKIFN